MTNKKQILNLIRQHCLRCCGESRKDVELCASGPDASPYCTCFLWPYRLGTDPELTTPRIGSGKKLKSILDSDESNDITETQISCKNT